MVLTGIIYRYGDYGMRTEVISAKRVKKLIIRRCHMCGQLNESYSETQRCCLCNKSFLPLNYFGKVHAKNSVDFTHLFEEAVNINENDLIKGLFAIW